MAPSNSTSRKAVGPTARALSDIAKRFELHLRVAREMHVDGYLKFEAEKPEYKLEKKTPTHDLWQLYTIRSYYGISIEKMIRIYNAGHIDLNGLDYEKVISRYLQRHSGQLSVRLLCYVVYDEVLGGRGRINRQAAFDNLSFLKINGKINPPKDLNPFMDAACRGEQSALDRVACWMRELIDSTGKPHGWAFFGLRLALVEGSYVLWTRPVPKLRRLRKFGKLAKLLRAHPLMSGCVTSVARANQNRDFSYVFHRPGEFWDL